MVTKTGLTYEDVQVGTALPETVLKLTIPVMQRWCVATETLRRDHYDNKYAIDHDGLPGAVLSGSMSHAYLWGRVFEWVYPSGWVYKLFQKNAAHVHPGVELTFFGKVTEKNVKNGLGYVTVDIGLRRNTDGLVVIPGNATVVLPLKGGKQVPYPFKP